jgi:hypothetical protein
MTWKMPSKENDGSCGVTICGLWTNEICGLCGLIFCEENDYDLKLNKTRPFKISMSGLEKFQINQTKKIEKIEKTQ